MTEIQKLRDRVEELERQIGLREVFPRPWKLTSREAQVAGLLLKHPIMQMAHLFEAIYGGDSDVNDKVIEVYIHKTRAKLRPLGIEIKNEYGYGYFIPPESKRRMRELIAEHEVEYDARKDFAGSLDEGYAAIRARVAAGGPGWTPGGTAP